MSSLYIKTNTFCFIYMHVAFLVFTFSLFLEVTINNNNNSNNINNNNYHNNNIIIKNNNNINDINNNSIQI